jgi:hypothetical protein
MPWHARTHDGGMDGAGCCERFAPGGQGNNEDAAADARPLAPQQASLLHASILRGVKPRL